MQTRERTKTTTPFEIHGMEYGNCNCAYGCPCQSNALPTHGDCQYLLFARVDSGFYGDTSLDGVIFAMYGKFSGAVHQGNGTQQLVIDEGADDALRAAVRAIIYNEESYEMKFHWAVYNAMSTSSLENVNGILRRDLPRKTELADDTEQDIQDIVWANNTTPRKRLGFLTPAEAFLHQLRCCT